MSSQFNHQKEGNKIIFKKNVLGVERVCRIVIGASIACGGLFFVTSVALMWGTIAIGAILACTGLISYCPMCAVAGRKSV